MVPQDLLTTVPGLVVIGGSLGGTDALRMLLPTLPQNFPAAVVVVLHRGADSDEILAQLLSRFCLLPVEEAYDKSPIKPGYVYLAPSGYHLLVEGCHFALSTEAPVAYARPSIDVLFESAAEAYGTEVVGVILTGAGHDGEKGLAAIRLHGGLTIAQTPGTAQCADMPNAAVSTGRVDAVLPLDGIVPFLLQRCGAW